MEWKTIALKLHNLTVLPEIMPQPQGPLSKFRAWPPNPRYRVFSSKVKDLKPVSSRDSSLRSE